MNNDSESDMFGGGDKRKKDNSSKGPRTGSYHSLSAEVRLKDSIRKAEYSREVDGDLKKERLMYKTDGTGAVVKSQNDNDWDGRTFTPDSADGTPIHMAHDKLKPNDIFKDTFHVDSAKLLAIQKGGKAKRKSKKSKSAKTSKKSKKGGKTSTKRKVVKKRSKKGGSCCGKP